MKKRLIATAMGLLAMAVSSQAVLVSGVDVTGETERTVDIARTVNIDITAVGSVDWNLFNLANGLTNAAESKLGGTAFGNYATTIDPSRVVPSAGEELMFNWTDGTTVASSAGTDMDLMVTTFGTTAEEVLTFDVTLPVSEHGYAMRWHLTDKRLATALNVWDGSAWVEVIAEAENDAVDLRVHTVIMLDVESETTLQFQITAHLTGSASALRCLGGLALEELIPATGSSFELDPSDQLDIALMAPATQAEGTVDASFSYGTSSNDVDITGVTFSNLSHGAGSFTCLDSFPVNLTIPTASNKTLTIQFDNTVAGLSYNESASGIALVSWTELGSGTTNTVELPVGATYYPVTAVNWSGTETVTADINALARPEINGTNTTLRWQAYAFDAVGGPLFTNLNPTAREFTGGVAVYSTNENTVVRMDRHRVADASPNDTIWFRSQDQLITVDEGVTNVVDLYDGVSIAAAYLWQPTESITLDDIINLDVTFNNLGAPGEARLLVRIDGQQYISESVGWITDTAYSLSSVTGLTWASYAPGDLVTDGGVTNSQADMRFSTAIVGGFSALPASSEISGIGVAAEVHGTAVGATDASFNLAKFVVEVPIPDTATPYETWAGDFGLTGSPDADPDYDYDGDGLDNLYEYGLGGDPTNSTDIGNVPDYAVTAAGGTNYFEYVYARRIAESSGLTYYLELNSDLVNGVWTNSGYTVLPVAGTIDPDFEAVTNRVETDSKSKEFIRLIIE
jgi:hypothetical protein